jgi:hypothetical protein
LEQGAAVLAEENGDRRRTVFFSIFFSFFASSGIYFDFLIYAASVEPPQH